MTTPNHPTRKPRAATILRAALLLTSIASSATASPLSIERLAFPTGNKSAQPSITHDPRTGFVITWQEPDNAGNALRFAIIDHTGKEQRRGTVSSGPDRFINGADFPNLAILDNGDWVTFWLQKTAASTYAYEIRTTRSRDQGKTWDPAIVVHRDATPTEHGFVSMAADGDDRARLVWLDGRKMAPGAHHHGEATDEHMTLRSAVLTRDETPIEESELDDLTCACCQTDMARGSQTTVALYRDRTSEEVRDIGAIVFEKNRASASARVHDDRWTMAGCPVNGPALAAHGDRYLAVWPTMPTGEMDIRLAFGDGHRFDPPRTLATGEHELGRVDVAAFGKGWLVSRVTSTERAPTLRLTTLSIEGATLNEQSIPAPTAGYPRLAVEGEVALIVFTQPDGRRGSEVSVWRAEAAGSTRTDP